MQSNANSQSLKVHLYQRIFSLALVAFCVVLCAYIFGSSVFSADLRSADDVFRLKVSQVVDEGGTETPIDVPHVWRGDPKEGATRKSYRVSLPVGAKFDDHALYISAYRQTVEVRLLGRLIAKDGNRKIIWLEPYPKPLSISLMPFSDLASEAESIVVDIEVRSSDAGAGGLGGVWYGSHKAIEHATPFYLSAMPSLLHANIGIISALILFLLIDSVRSVESRLRIIMAIPHLSYAFLCLPEIEFLDTITWLKLYQVSINCIVLTWIYVGFYALGLFQRWLAIPMAIITLVTLPYFYIDDYVSLMTWTYKVQNLLIGVMGLVIMLYFGWRIPDSNNRTLHVIFLLAGVSLAGAGVNDINLNFSGNQELRLLVLPFAALMVSVVLLLWTSLEMLQRNQQISKQQARMKELIDLRTNALSDAKSQLMQHRRYQALNTMGAAISHEIKNPLAALNNDLTLLELKLKAVKGIDTPIERMQRTVQRIDNTISELTDFSRRQSIHRKIVHLSTWAHQLCASAEVQALLGDISFQVLIEPDIEARIDQGLMRRALVNVLDNAVFALRGHASPEIKLHVVSNSDFQQVEISIIDNGCGLATGDVEYLFEPLVSGSQNGLGLGLAIVRDIMVLHLGEVRLSNNTVGEGAILTMAFPKA